MNVVFPGRSLLIASLAFLWLASSSSANAAAPKVIRPFAEYEPAGYLLMNSQFIYSSKEVKKTILENLPEDMAAVIFLDKKRSRNSALKIFGQFIDEDRLMIIDYAIDVGFWARDTIPVPVFVEDGDDQTLGVVDARYFSTGSEPDRLVSKTFDAKLIRHRYKFEGGNFLADARGNCLTLEVDWARKVPDHIFKNKYGCSTILRLDYVRGGGHIDEVVKLVDDGVALTDEKAYIEPLENAGYEAHMLPRGQGKYENYVNSLIANDKVFLPVFGRQTDRQAIEVYESFGYEVVPISTKTLSNRGKGSIHCITMTYPY